MRLPFIGKARRRVRVPSGKQPHLPAGNGRKPVQVRLPHELIEFGQEFKIDSVKVANRFFKDQKPSIRVLERKVAEIALSRDRDALLTYYQKHRKEKRQRQMMSAISLVTKAVGIPLPF